MRSDGRRERIGIAVLVVGAPLATLAAHLTFTPVGVLDLPAYLAVAGVGGWLMR